MDPNNAETLLALARLESHIDGTPEGLEYYRKTIGILMKTSTDEVVTVFEEYYPRYRARLEPDIIQYRIASLLHRKGHFDLAERALVQLADSSDVNGDLKEQALFYSARILEQMGLPDPARRYYVRFIEEYPESERNDSVRARLALLVQTESPDLPVQVGWR